ncbi:hypothetical protein QJQ45_009192 [Haematococcus lacustris]|nr:hypothetical protein QJQ45_009192 [Haematococcus lacustris]
MLRHAAKPAYLHRCLAVLRSSTKPTSARGYLKQQCSQAINPGKQCSSVDHHQPEQPVSLPGAPQPQFDNEAELARVAQFQEHFRELDQALTALQPLPGPPAQPTGTPLRLFNRFAVLDLESGSRKRQRTQPPSTATPDLTLTTVATTSPATTSHSVVLRHMGSVARVLKRLSWSDRAAVISLLQEQGIIEQPADSHILGAMVLARMKTLNQTGTCGKAGGQRLADLQAKANLARLVPPEVKEQRRVTAFAKASGMDRAAVAQAASENATALTTDPTGRLLYFTERLDQRGNPGISQAQFDGVRQAWHDYTKPSPSVKDLCQFSERMVAGSQKRTLVTETKRYYDSSEEEIWRQYFENFTPCREARGPVALSLFGELKPRWVKKLTEAQRQVCVCRTCCNINFLLKALAKHKSLLQLPSPPEPPEPHPQPHPQPQHQHQPLIDDGDEDIHSPFSDPNHEFEHGAAAFSHQTTTSQIPTLSASVVQRFTVQRPQEIQSEHWCPHTVGILVACVYFKTASGAYREETVYVLTDGNDQSAPATQAALYQVIAHLKHNGDMDLQELFMWSDGCAGQFKGLNS